MFHSSFHFNFYRTTAVCAVAMCSSVCLSVTSQHYAYVKTRLYVHVGPRKQWHTIDHALSFFSVDEDISKTRLESPPKEVPNASSLR